MCFVDLVKDFPQVRLICQKQLSTTCLPPLPPVPCILNIADYQFHWPVNAWNINKGPYWLAEVSEGTNL